MKKCFIFCLAVFLSFLFCQCNNNSNILNEQTDKLQEEIVSATINDDDIVTENVQARAQADNIIFYDNDFLQTKEPMSDDAIAPFDYKTGLVGNKAYNIKVYTTALERVKRNLTERDNQLIIKVKSGKELNMAEDLFTYISDLICKWNNLIKEGQYDIVNIENSYYDIEPNIKQIKSARNTIYDLMSMQTHNERYEYVKSVVNSESIGTYVGDHFYLNFGKEIGGSFYVSGKVKRYYVCNGCLTHGGSSSSPTCGYNYIATFVTVPDAAVNIYALRNVSQLAVITYQSGK